MNPLTKANFIPNEPDINADGIIDLWEGTSYSYGFNDTDHDGFDDTYEGEVLEPASEENFDVVVDVYTTRSAVLTWANTNGIDGIVILPTTGTAVKLRLPVGIDTQLTLVPSPNGSTTFDSNSLWKARARTSFMPRTGQAGSADFVACINGGIMHKVFEGDSTIAKLPESSTSSNKSGGIASLASAVTADLPLISLDLVFSDCHIEPPVHFYHDLGDIARTFSITNSVGIDTNTVALAWSVDFGSMTPTSGLASTFSASSLPPDDGKATVSLTVDIGHGIHLAAYATVEPCPRHGFLLESFTSNFSPQLGETNTVSVTLPGCTHYNDHGWLEAEIRRETLTCWQHVAYVDMDTSTETLDQYGDTTQLSSHPVFTWDGYAQVSLPLADNFDTFNEGTNAFHRAMPAVESGKAVPPPFYTLFVTLYENDKTTIRYQETRTIYVPQVVSIQWLPEAVVLFQQPFSYYFDEGGSIELYSGYTGGTSELITNLLQRVKDYYPPDVNIRFTANTPANDYFVKKVVVNANVNEFNKEFMLGNSGICERNERVGLGIRCDGGSFFASQKETYRSYARNAGKTFVLQTSPFTIPITTETFLQAVARAIAHETGHSLGLVSSKYMRMNKEYPGHNPEVDFDKIMNYSGNTLEQQLENPGEWTTLNRDYLKFILPRW